MTIGAPAAEVRPPAERTRAELILLAIPAAFVVSGLCIRLAAYFAAFPDATLAEFPQIVCRWDCEWYVRLAEGGYDPFPVPSMSNAGNWAFFPLMPMIVGLLRQLLGLPTMPLAIAVSTTMAFAAARLSWPFFEGNRRAYAIFSAFLLSGPFSIYFTTFFTEALFVLLTVAVFVALRRSDYLLAGAAAALLSATRIVGVFAVFAIAVQAFVDHRRGGGTTGSFLPAALRKPELVLAIVLAPLGLFLYMAFLHFWIGDALAFSHVQRAWARVVGNPLQYLWSGLTGPAGRDDGWLSPSQLLALAAIVGLGLTGYLAWRRQYAAAIFCAICLILPLFTGLASMVRFTSALAPLVIAASALLSRDRMISALTLLVLLGSAYTATEAWFGWSLALV